MHASAQRENKTASSSVDFVRRGAQAAARNPPGKQMPAIAPPSDLVVLQCKMQNRSVESGKTTTAPGQTTTTGLPSALKAGIEGLSGMPMDDVHVHYNSDKPAQVEAHAFTQGTEIHVAPGQEEHLPHEAWHALQQKQKRVPSTMQMKGVAVNDDEALEHEATEMGKRAAKWQPSAARARGDVQQETHPATSMSSPVVQRKGIGSFFKGAGKVAGNVLLGPLWDAGKAIKRRYQGGNLFFGSGDYRRHGRQYPAIGNNEKQKEYQDKADMTASYGGETAGRIGRAVNVLSAFAGDVAKYTGWGAGVSGLIMIATGGAAAPVLAPVTTVLSTIAALGLTAKLSLTAFNQAYLANRLDTQDNSSDALRDEERYARSDYGRAMLASAAFGGIGLGAEASSGSGLEAAWLETTGQTAASSSLPEVAAGMGGEATLETGDTIAEETEWKPIKPFEANQKPKNSWWGLHRLNPVYMLVRGVKTIATGLVAIWNSFRPANSHKETKKDAAFKVGDTIDGNEGWGLKAAKFGAGALLGAGGAALGAIGGTLAGAAGGAWAAMKKGAEKGNNLGGALGGFVGGALGLLGGGLLGAGAGLVVGTTVGATSGWDLGHGKIPQIKAKVDGLMSSINSFAALGANSWNDLQVSFVQAVRA